MKKINIYLPLGLFILIFIMASCQKDEKSSIGLSMKATDTSSPSNPTQEPGQSSLFTASLPLEWDVAWIYLTSFEFSADYRNFSEINGKNIYPDFHFEWTGMEKIDLLAESKIFANIELPDGQYNRIEIRMVSDIKNEMNDPNLYLSGTFGPAIGGIPIAVSVNQSFELLSMSDEYLINTQVDDFFHALVEVSLDGLFTGISVTDLENAELVDGWIIISAEHNQWLFAKILENLKAVGGSGLSAGFHLRP